MPKYHVVSNISIFPQQSAVLLGWPAVPGGPSELASDLAETIATGDKSIAVSPSLTLGMHGYQARMISWHVKYGTAPSAISLILQGSLEDVDGDYITVDTSTNTAGETRTTAVTNLRFYRLLASTVTGACTAIVKVACM